MPNPTSNYGWLKPDVGASNDQWGGLLNTDLDGIDATVWSVSQSVPQASGSLPLMDGTAAVGSGTTWARADHVHPSDTSRVAKAGDTMTGALTGTAATFSGQLMTTSGNAVSQASGAGNAAFVMQNNAGTNVGYCQWTPAGIVGLQHAASGGQAYLDSGGAFNTTGIVIAGTGYRPRSGMAGATQPNTYNIDWVTSQAHLWMDSTNLGQIAFVSDYRIKDNIENLPSTWDRVKALRPISYILKDYTPPVELERAEAAGVEPPPPFIQGDPKPRWGFIAHELQETLIMDAASGYKDAPDAIQSPNPWTVIAALTSALQEAMARIEALEAAANG